MYFKFAPTKKERLSGHDTTKSDTGAQFSVFPPKTTRLMHGGAAELLLIYNVCIDLRTNQIQDGDDA